MLVPNTQHKSTVYLLTYLLTYLLIIAGYAPTAPRPCFITPKTAWAEEQRNSGVEERGEGSPMAATERRRVAR